MSSYPVLGVYSTARGRNAFFWCRQGFFVTNKVIQMIICVLFMYMSVLYGKNIKNQMSLGFFLCLVPICDALFLRRQLTVKCIQFIFGFCFHFYLVISIFFPFQHTLRLQKCRFFIVWGNLCFGIWHFMLVAEMYVFGHFCANYLFLIRSFGVSSLFIAEISSSGGPST